MCAVALVGIYPVSDNAAKWQKGNGRVKSIIRRSAVQREIIKITVL